MTSCYKKIQKFFGFDPDYIEILEKRNNILANTVIYYKNELIKEKQKTQQNNILINKYKNQIIDVEMNCKIEENIIQELNKKCLNLEKECILLQISNEDNAIKYEVKINDLENNYISLESDNLNQKFQIQLLNDKCHAKDDMIQQLEEKIINFAGLCVICVENKASNVYIPCGHICVCNDCYNKINGCKCLYCGRASQGSIVCYATGF